MEMLLEVPKESYVVDNRHVKSEVTLSSPNGLKAKYPVSPHAEQFVYESRKIINNILNGRDPRLLVVVGPCSIHDVDAAIEYAKKLKSLSEKLNDTLYIVMRVYFEKPRTTVGWKGLINDPDLDGSLQMGKGLEIARKLLLQMAEYEIPVATEALDPVTPQYLHDLVSWTAIGARTTESQTHREMASGLSSAIGFKNSTDGNINIVINAIKSCAHPHGFLGIDGDGRVAVVSTTGNKNAHIVLRGGNGQPNYSPKHIQYCDEVFREHGLEPRIMVDCSHVNSLSDHRNQPNVLRSVSQQIVAGNRSIKGVMIESHLFEGNQKINDDMQYGVSVTDKCMGWESTEHYLVSLYKELKHVLPKRVC